MDLLTDVLQTFHLQSTVLHRGRLTAPWGVRFAPQERDKGDAAFHVVTEGRTLLELTGEEATCVTLNTGDFVLLPYGTSYSLRDARDTPVHPVEVLRRPGDTDADGTIHFGANEAGARAARVACGIFRIAGGATHPFLQALPKLIVVRGEQGRALPWLEATLSFLASEADSDRPGAQTVMSRLCDILFVQAIRAHLQEMPPCAQGWLAAARDPDISKALQAIHARPEHGWTVEAMAREAGLSRSAFAARFCTLMGEPPLQYLTRWRVHVATELLRDTRLPLLHVAEKVGYESEASFSKVFKARAGMSPGAFRRQAYSVSE